MIDGKQYSYRNDFRDERHRIDSSEVYGFIAQELKEVVPAAVKEDTEGYLAVNYDMIIPLLVEGVKSQQKEIEELKSIIVQKEGINIDEEDGQNPEESVRPTNGIFELNQNNPNPFGSSTVIGYKLDGDFDNAMIGIYDLTGQQKQLVNLNGNNVNGEITVYSNEIGGAGQYVYSLIVDGRIVDSKKMVILGN